MFLSKSDNKLNSRLYLFLKDLRATSESKLTPKIEMLYFSNVSNSSRNPQACLIQPGVCTLGKK